jgi:hypothetical protein
MDLNILWLVPIAYLIHIFEETPRFVPWAKRYLLSTMTFPEFILGNCIFMAYVLISVFLATSYPGEWTLVLGLSTAAWIFSNFLIHAYYTLSTGEYSPGVVTAGAVYVPVSLYIYTNFVGSGILTNLDILLSIIIGFAVMYVPTLIQSRRDKIRKKNPN